MSGSNVVPMPMNMPAQFQGTWPPPASFPAGCCPPGGGMDHLLQCYCDIQAAKAFIGKIVLDLIACDPAFTQAIVDAIAASGSNIPLVGVTNGSSAQPGQVGEIIGLGTTLQFTSSGLNTVVGLGTLPPGDWDCWAYTNQSESFGSFVLSPPLPAGFDSDLNMYSPSAQNMMVAPMATARTSVPTLIAFSVAISSTTSGEVILNFRARRRR